MDCIPVLSEEAIQIIGDSRQKEFEQLALVHLRALLRAAVRLARDVAIAEDLVQDAMLRAWRHFDRFEPGTNCKAWLLPK